MSTEVDPNESLDDDQLVAAARVQAGWVEREHQDDEAPSSGTTWAQPAEPQAP